MNIAVQAVAGIVAVVVAAAVVVVAAVAVAVAVAGAADDLLTTTAAAQVGQVETLVRHIDPEKAAHVYCAKDAELETHEPRDQKDQQIHLDRTSCTNELVQDW